MPNKVITLCYRKIIDVNYSNAWDQFVFEDSYAEFKMQAQFYNQDQKYSTFSELILNEPNAEKLHFLVGNAIIGYIKQLNGIVPEILDNLGRRFLTFENFKFEMINSNIHQIDKHKIAINFFSKPLIWHNSIDDYLLVSQFKENVAEEIFTNLFKLQPFLSIYSLKNLD